MSLNFKIYPAPRRACSQTSYARDVLYINPHSPSPRSPTHKSDASTPIPKAASLCHAVLENARGDIEGLSIVGQVMILMGGGLVYCSVWK